MDSVIFYQPPATTGGHHSRSVAPVSLSRSASRLPISARSPTPDGFYASADSSDELPLLQNLLAPTQPNKLQGPPEVIDLTVDMDNNVSLFA